jgi:predicted nucleotidyltransferase
MRGDLQIDQRRLAAFCRRHHIRRLSFYGSVLRADFGPHSDVDVLVEFTPEAHLGLLQIAAMELKLSEILGREVDMREAEDLSRYFRDQVVAEAEVAYAA